MVSPDTRPTIPATSIPGYSHEPRSHTYVPPMTSVSPSTRRPPQAPTSTEAAHSVGSPLLSLGNYQPDKSVVMHHSIHQSHLFSPQRTPSTSVRADGYTSTMYSPQRVITSTSGQGTNSPSASYRPITTQGGAVSPSSQSQAARYQAFPPSRVYGNPTTTEPVSGGRTQPHQSPAPASLLPKKHPTNLGLDRYRLLDRGFPTDPILATPTLESALPKSTQASASKSKHNKPQQATQFMSPKSIAAKEIIIPGVGSSTKQKKNILRLENKQTSVVATVTSGYYLQTEPSEQHPDVPCVVDAGEQPVHHQSITLIPIKSNRHIHLAPAPDTPDHETPHQHHKIPHLETSLKLPLNLATYSHLQHAAKSSSTLGVVPLGGTDSTNSVSGVSNKGSGGANSAWGVPTQSQSSTQLNSNSNLLLNAKDSLNGSKRAPSTAAGSHSIMKAAKAPDSGSASSKSMKINNIYSNLGNLSATSRGSNTNSSRPKAQQVKSNSVSRERRAVIRSLETGLNRGNGTGRKVSNAGFTSPTSDEPRAVRSFIGSSSHKEGLSSPLVGSMSFRVQVRSGQVLLVSTPEEDLCLNQKNLRSGNARTHLHWTHSQNETREN